MKGLDHKHRKILIKGMLDILDFAYSSDLTLTDKTRLDEIAYTAEMVLEEVNHKKVQPYSHSRLSTEVVKDNLYEPGDTFGWLQKGF